MRVPIFRTLPRWVRHKPFTSFLIALLIASANLPGQPVKAAAPDEEPPFNIPVKTLGGRQIWSDVHLLGGWRIQENVLTGHFRLLDNADIRRAWGNIDQCMAALTAAREESGLSFGDKHLVLLLHGLGRHRKSMTKLKEQLEKAGFQAETIAYASTRRGLEEHADTLLRLLGSLESIETVSFVTHSLGGLVARTTLARKADWPSGLAVEGLVMLAPPSNGAELADRLERFTPFRVIGGPATDQLRPDETDKVPLPHIRHCIIAGGRGTEDGYNPLIEGDDDGIVGVEEAKLQGTDDFLVVGSIHTVIMDNPQATAATIQFLNGGKCKDLS